MHRRHGHSRRHSDRPGECSSQEGEQWASRRWLPSGSGNIHLRRAMGCPSPFPSIFHLNDVAMKSSAPNTRVQRTRSSPSAHRSPLTRYPLGANRWYPARGASSVARSSVRLCTPRASAMRADECGEWMRAAAWRRLEIGDSPLQESARPPAQAAPSWRFGGRSGSDVESRQPVAARGRECGWRAETWRVNPAVAERLTRA